MQQMSAAVVRLSSLQMQLALQGTSALQLQQQQLPGYGQLLQLIQEDPQQQEGRGAIQLDDVASFRQQPLCHQLFELQLQQQPGGWQVPRYSVFLHDKSDLEEAEDGDVSAAAAAADQQQPGVMDDAAASLLQLLPQR
jgi:hypothetical protein